MATIAIRGPSALEFGAHDEIEDRGISEQRRIRTAHDADVDREQHRQHKDAAQQRVEAQRQIDRRRHQASAHTGKNGEDCRDHRIDASGNQSRRNAAAERKRAFDSEIWKRQQPERNHDAERSKSVDHALHQRDRHQIEIGVDDCH